jgi:hypothetical protein
LAFYADAFSPDEVSWTASNRVWPLEYSSEIADQLPPHEQVLFVLLRKYVNISSPQQRTSSAQALLAVVAKAANGVSLGHSFVSPHMLLL